jgi:acetolactate synthase-1/2/3 large subunit
LRQKVSDYIADSLVAFGIGDVFTITGGGAIHLNDSFGHREGLRCLYNHHEQACAIAAEAYARLTNKIAAVCVTSGPGGTNALTGVMGGWVDSIPMLVISGQVKFSTTIGSTKVPLRQLGDQEFNIVDCAKHMTKYAVMVTDPLDIAYHLERALYLAVHDRPGPVWLDIPLNVQAALIDTEELRHWKRRRISGLSSERLSMAAAQVLERLRRARRPVILAGGGIRGSGGVEDFWKLIEKLRIPVTTAWNAHDLLWDDHPLYCGRPGTVGTRGGNFVVQNSDFLLSLGCRMNIRQISYNWENFARDAFLAAVDIDGAELEKPTLSVDLPIQADVGQFMREMRKIDYEDGNRAHRDWLDWCRRINGTYPVVLPEYRRKAEPVNPYVFMESLSERLGGEDVVVAGNGSACVCSFQAMKITRGLRLFTNSGCASMGYGLPASIGVALARGGSRVICLEGDGSIQMNLQELQTVVHNNLNIKIFWLNNAGYHSIRQTQRNLFNSRFCGISADTGVSFPSAERIAYAYGIPFFRLESHHGLSCGLDRVIASEGPAICEVILDPAQDFAPKLSAKILPDGTMVSPSLEDMYPFLPEEEMRENQYADGRGEDDTPHS